jgi:twitching motility two-component system response regulator PilG
MSDKKTFAIAVFGIPEPERNVLKNIFKLSLYRAYTYALVSSDQSSAILLVDADDPRAMKEWRTFTSAGMSALDEGKASLPVPTVMVTKETPAETMAYCIRRPFVATRVLGVLDQVAAAQVAKGSGQEDMPGEEKPTAARTAEPAVPTALVVDDSSTIRRLIELELKLFNIQVDAVESGEEAFELLAQNNYDLVFLDVVLPGADGYQICKTIKKDKARKKMPVIMLTSKSSPFDRIKGALAGCDTYLTKPVSHSSFQKVVKKYLESS